MCSKVENMRLWTEICVFWDFMHMNHPEAKQSVNNASSFFLCLWEFPTVGLHRAVWSCTYLDLVGDHCTISYAMFHSSSRKWNSCQWSRPSHVYCSNMLPAIHGTAPNVAYGWLYRAVWITQFSNPTWHWALPSKGLSECMHERWCPT